MTYFRDQIADFCRKVLNYRHLRTGSWRQFNRNDEAIANLEKISRNRKKLVSSI